MRASTTKNNPKDDKRYVLLSIGISIILWKAISLWVGKSIIIPSPEETTVALIGVIKNPEFNIAVYNTMKRIFIGFSFTFILSLVLGMVSGFYSTVYYILKPVVTVFKAVPTMAVILLAIIWLESEAAPILVGFLVTFPLLYQNVVQGIVNIDSQLVEMAKVYKVSKIKMVREIYLPSIKSYLLAGISTALGLTVKIVIAAEVLSQPKISIGTSFQMEKSNLNTAGVFAWAIIAIFIAGAFDILIKYAQKNTKGVYHK